MGLGQRKCRTRRKLEDTERKDMISNLPDEVLGHILSMLPTKYAVATSILSSRWTNLYKLSSNLDFDDSVYFNPRVVRETRRRNIRFEKFVDRVLALCKSSHVSKFRLKCGRNCEASLISDWIDAAFLHKVTELELSIDTSFQHELHLPPLICHNLVVLKLDCKFVMCIPKSVTFPCLKVFFFKEIKFKEIEFEDDSNGELSLVDLNGLLSGCPLLEELVLSGCNWTVGELYISNPLLRRLTLDVGTSGPLDELFSSPVYFDLPSLVYLEFCGYLAEKYDIRNLNAVIHAHFDIGFNDDDYEDPQDLCDTMVDLILGVCNCEVLYLSRQCLEALSSGEFELPVFHNLTQLDLYLGCEVSWSDVLLDFLKSAPCLETLTLVQNSKGELDADFLLDDQPVPSCVTSRLKAIQIGNFVGLKEEMDMVMYFLQNANVLEEMVIRWQQWDRASVLSWQRRNNTTISLSTEEEVLKLPRASKMCTVVFK